MVGIFLCVLAAVGLYWLRCRHLFWYGAIELVVGLIVLRQLFYPASLTLIADNPSQLGLFLTGVGGKMLGIYILVRGLDNMAIMDRVFPK